MFGHLTLEKHQHEEEKGEALAHNVHERANIRELPVSDKPWISAIRILWNANGFSKDGVWGGAWLQVAQTFVIKSNKKLVQYQKNNWYWHYKQQ